MGTIALLYLRISVQKYFYPGLLFHIEKFKQPYETYSILRHQIIGCWEENNSKSFRRLHE